MLWFASLLQTEVEVHPNQVAITSYVCTFESPDRNSFSTIILCSQSGCDAGCLARAGPSSDCFWAECIGQDKTVVAGESEASLICSCIAGKSIDALRSYSSIGAHALLHSTPCMIRMSFLGMTFAMIPCSWLQGFLAMIVLSRPDMTFTVDWVLKTNYLSISRWNKSLYHRDIQWCSP